MSLSFKTQLLLTLDDLGAQTTKMLTHRLSISNMHYPAYYTTLRRLGQQDLIKKKKRGKFITISLTAEGKALLHKQSMGKRRHDGLSTVIAFDVPEEKSKARQALRRYLVKHGYTLLQESILIAPTHATAELKDLIRELGIRSNVKIIAGRIEYG